MIDKTIARYMIFLLGTYFALVHGNAGGKGETYRPHNNVLLRK